MPVTPSRCHMLPASAITRALGSWTWHLMTRNQGPVHAGGVLGHARPLEALYKLKILLILLPITTTFNTRHLMIWIILTHSVKRGCSLNRCWACRWCFGTCEAPSWRHCTSTTCARPGWRLCWTAWTLRSASCVRPASQMCTPCWRKACCTPPPMAFCGCSCTEALTGGLQTGRDGSRQSLHKT